MQSQTIGKPSYHTAFDKPKSSPSTKTKKQRPSASSSDNSSEISLLLQPTPGKESSDATVLANSAAVDKPHFTMTVMTLDVAEEWNPKVNCCPEKNLEAMKSVGELENCSQDTYSFEKLNNDLLIHSEIALRLENPQKWEETANKEHK